jgi:hypothetical protein
LPNSLSRTRSPTRKSVVTTICCFNFSDCSIAAKALIARPSPKHGSTSRSALLCARRVGGPGSRISLRSTPAQRQPFVPSFGTTRPRSPTKNAAGQKMARAAAVATPSLCADYLVRLTAWRPLSRWLEPPRQAVGRCMIDTRPAKRMQARYPKRKTRNRPTRRPAPRFPKYAFYETPQIQRYPSATTARRQ